MRRQSVSAAFCRLTPGVGWMGGKSGPGSTAVSRVRRECLPGNLLRSVKAVRWPWPLWFGKIVALSPNWILSRLGARSNLGVSGLGLGFKDVHEQCLRACAFSIVATVLSWSLALQCWRGFVRLEVRSGVSIIGRKGTPLNSALIQYRLSFKRMTNGVSQQAFNPLVQRGMPTSLPSPSNLERAKMLRLNRSKMGTLHSLSHFVRGLHIEARVSIASRGTGHSVT